MKKLNLANAAKAITNPKLALKYLRLNQESKQYDKKLVEGYFKEESVYQGYLAEIQSSGLFRTWKKNWLAMKNSSPVTLGEQKPEPER